LNLLPDPEGQAIYEIASVEPGNQLLVRRCLANSPDKLERTANLTAPLGGAPAVGSKSILLPLADGTLVRLALPLTAEGGTLAGPDWRAGNFGTEQLGYAVWLGGDDFLTTNGQRGLTWWSFDNKEWRSRPEGKNARRPTQELAYPIVAPPLVLTRPGNKVPLRLCVADASGTIHLLEGDELKPVRQWVLKGKLTAGPFLRDGKVGCVVERRRLVWLDPGKDGEWLWHYESPGGEIVGQPQLVEGVVLVAHLSGRFVGLDPVTGKPRGPGFTLKASVAPAASPVAFGPGRLFAPLTDGTVLLLSLEDFRSGAANKGGS
jgi:outer membrane protein assembly factor BamB